MKEKDIKKLKKIFKYGKEKKEIKVKNKLKQLTLEEV